jgi:hypothetical protein
MNTVKDRKIVYSIAAIICFLILGAGIITAQYMRQASIERQKQMEINQANRIRMEREIDLATCMDEAGSEYWRYMELNGTKDAKGMISAPNYRWSIAEENKQRDIDNCFKRYK